jgi:hypothetical protein
MRGNNYSRTSTYGAAADLAGERSQLAIPGLSVIQDISFNICVIFYGFGHLGNLFPQLNERDFSLGQKRLRKQNIMRVCLAVFLDNANETKFANPANCVSGIMIFEI